MEGDPIDPRAAGLNVIDSSAYCFGSGACGQGQRIPWSQPASVNITTEAVIRTAVSSSSPCLRTRARSSRHTAARNRNRARAVVSIHARSNERAIPLYDNSFILMKKRHAWRERRSQEKRGTINKSCIGTNHVVKERVMHRANHSGRLLPLEVRAIPPAGHRSLLP